MRDAIIIGFAFAALLLAGATLHSVQGLQRIVDSDHIEILKLRENLNQILAARTGQPLDRIKADSERDYFMSAAEAKDYGLIDQVLVQRT